MKEDIASHIRLKSITKDDFISVLSWSQDEGFCLANDWEINKDYDELFNWWLNCVNDERLDFIRLGIEYKDKIVGYADLTSISDHTAEIGMAIGDSALWGQGLGHAAALHILDYGSKELGINIFYAETMEDNLRSQGLLKKLGFLEISRSKIQEDEEKRPQSIRYKLIL